jgi:hypothetical protein
MELENKTQEIITRVKFYTPNGGLGQYNVIGLNAQQLVDKIRNALKDKQHAIVIQVVPATDERITERLYFTLVVDGPPVWIEDVVNEMAGVKKSTLVLQ